VSAASQAPTASSVPSANRATPCFIGLGGGLATCTTGLSPARFSACAVYGEFGQKGMTCSVVLNSPKRVDAYRDGPTTLSSPMANLWQAMTGSESIEPLVLVGATGFEPVTPSVSAKPREPLCYPPFSQVGPDRRGGRETLS
jgi:hypothetical protein